MSICAVFLAEQVDIFHSSMRMASQKSLETIRADDYIEYYIYPDLGQQLTSIEHTDKLLDELIVNLNADVGKLAADYIWHRDPIRLVKCNSLPLNEGNTGRQLYQKAFKLNIHFIFYFFV